MWHVRLSFFLWGLRIAGTYLCGPKVFQARTVRNGPKIAYWVIADCHYWNDAETECQRANGHLAAFPEMEDKVYLQRFLSPFVVGKNE